MKYAPRLCAGLLASLCAWQAAAAAETVILPSTPSLSPDGSRISFAWRGDIWSVATKGGRAKRLTTHSGREQQPKFSPDGKRIAFVGDHGAGNQLFVMPSGGGAPIPQTAHSAGYALDGWFSDGKSLLATATRDQFWKRGERFWRVQVVDDLEEQRADKMLFDDYGSEASLSPDGSKLLFVREGAPWFRKGYSGSQDGQIWLYELATKKFTKLRHTPGGCRWPLWKPTGDGYYYVAAGGGSTNLWESSLQGDTTRQLTHFTDDGPVFPTLSRDGSTLAFRVLFDLYSLSTKPGSAPQKIRIAAATDSAPESEKHVTLAKSTQADFTNDGLEIAFVAGGDVWVMDTELREPRQVTDTPEEERDVRWSPDGESLWFVSDRDGQADIWRAKRKNVKRFWWRNEEFSTERVTNDAEVESSLKFSPEGSRLAYVRGVGDLWTRDVEGSDPKLVVESFDETQFDWSPDAKWIVYAIYDEEFNRDVWIRPADGSGAPFNVSRHPDNDGAPVWSPDGKLIAFTGRRSREEVDIHYVWLRKQDEDLDEHARKLQTALEKLQKARAKPAAGPTATKPTQSKPEDTAQGDSKPDDKKPEATKPAPEAAAAKKAPDPVQIDFDGLHERLHTIRISDAVEQELAWSPDSKKLAFVSTIRDQKGLFTVEFPTPSKPTLVVGEMGEAPRWLSAGNQIVWLVDGVPSSAAVVGGKVSSYRFVARQTIDLGRKYRAALDLCWRTMRDNWYDPHLGNKNWDEIRRKYADAAEQARDDLTFGTVVTLMLGELNGSHLGFLPSSLTRTSDPGTWTEATAHLGVRFDPTYRGPGLRIRDVLPQGPADDVRSRLSPGEIIVSIDGRAVDPAMDLTKVLNGPPARDIQLKVKNSRGEEREVVLRPLSYDAVARLLYEKWVRDNRRFVESVTKGQAGYVHIAGMDEPSLLKFEEELFSAASGKRGLVIDVRENGGGSTTDHLLTMLTQPRHAITVPRGGKPGYPQDRKIYASWNKPIVVLCNQNSFSNAEIFSHAIKTLKRGKIVGVPTAGGVVSTGAVSIMDIGTLRLPFRGWFLPDSGEDMELHGCVPDVVIWPEPGDMPRGKDTQLEQAIKTLFDEIKTFEAQPKPKLRYATQRAAKP